MFQQQSQTQSLGEVISINLSMNFLTLIIWLIVVWPTIMYAWASPDPTLSKIFIGFYIVRVPLLCIISFIWSIIFYKINRPNLISVFTFFPIASIVIFISLMYLAILLS
jgi:hypothetical protein